MQSKNILFQRQPIFASMTMVQAHVVAEQEMLLSPQRCMYWPAAHTLLLADLHLAKTGHFRKAGIAVPQQVYQQDLQRLVTQIQFFKPQRLLVLGDMVHSHANKELDWFARWRKDFSSLAITLVMGNHDILQQEWYSHNAIAVQCHAYQEAPFTFIHDIADAAANNGNRYTFCGHLHPAIAIKSSSRQSLRLPCFYFGRQYGVLPAFSHFSGYHTIKPRRNEKVFAIVQEEAHARLLAV
jgi:uncharacterized protein